MAAIRLGVLGGSFNPIHKGHIYVARRVCRLFELSHVHFVVAAVPPHKSFFGLAPLLHRYAMVSLALAGSKAMVPSLIELDAPASPFSLHTMRKFERSCGGRHARLYFIAGGDSLREVGSWHESETLLASYSFIFVARPAAPIRDPARLLPPNLRGRLVDLRADPPVTVRRRIRAAESGRSLRIYLLDISAPPVSSTAIRRRIRTRKPFEHLVPDRVYEYITKLQLYGEQ